MATYVIGKANDYIYRVTEKSNGQSPLFCINMSQSRLVKMLLEHYVAQKNTYFLSKAARRDVLKALDNTKIKKQEEMQPETSIEQQSRIETDIAVINKAIYYLDLH